MNLQDQQLGLGKLAFLGAASMALCSFVPFTVIAPAPLALAFLQYGRLKAMALALLVLLGFLVVSSMFGMASFYVGSYVLVIIHAAIISEIVYRKVPPTKGLIGIGLGLSVLVFIAIAFYLAGSQETLTTHVEKLVVQLINKVQAEKADVIAAGGVEGMLIKEAMSHPDKIASDLVSMFPSVMFMSSFVTLWASFFLVMRNAFHWRPYRSYPYGLRDLTDFNLPDYFVWFLIAGLVMMLGGEEYLGHGFEVVGENLLTCLAVFYFFKGFGIYTDLLSHLKIFGIFRALLTAMTVLMAYKMLVIVGMFDMWVNFRKYMKKIKTNKNSNEGDIS